jgi:hypothetical protein
MPFFISSSRTELKDTPQLISRHSLFKYQTLLATLIARQPINYMIILPDTHIVYDPSQFVNS